MQEDNFRYFCKRRRDCDLQRARQQAGFLVCDTYQQNIQENQPPLGIKVTFVYL
jgi:hypothetical protein